MKMTSPHLSTVTDPTIVDVGRAVDELAEMRRADPELDDGFVLLETADGTGAFIQAITVDDSPRWMIEVCNSDEASLRGLREPVTRGRAVELLGNFVQGDRSMGNGAEWLDVDFDATRRKTTPTGLALGILAILAVAVAIWFYSRHA